MTLPIAVFIMTGFLKTLPKELFEAAAIDGSGPWRTYRSIVIPVSVPSLSATAIFLFVIHWNDLLYPLLFIQDAAKRTIPVALLSFQGEFLTNYPLLFTGVVVASAPDRHRLRLPAAILRRRHHRRRREGLTVTDTARPPAPHPRASVPTRAGVTLDLDALPGVQLGMMPGWLTGEPLAAQGVETQMPNLPDIALPPTDVTPYALRVTAPQPSACGSSSPRRGTPPSRTTAPASASSSTRRRIRPPSRWRSTTTDVVRAARWAAR